MTQHSGLFAFESIYYLSYKMCCTEKLPTKMVTCLFACFSFCVSWNVLLPDTEQPQARSPSPLWQDKCPVTRIQDGFQDQQAGQSFSVTYAHDFFPFPVTKGHYLVFIEVKNRKQILEQFYSVYQAGQLILSSTKITQHLEKRLLDIICRCCSVIVVDEVVLPTLGVKLFCWACFEK